jgi:hypothetical protein
MAKRREILIGVAGILLFAAAAYCGWLWLQRESRPRSPEALAQIALSAEPQSAAGKLDGQPGHPGQPQGAAQQQLAAVESGGQPRGAEQQSAAVELVRLGAPALPQMRQVFHESQSRDVRAQMILGLAQQWDLDSMPAFLEAMDDPSPLIRGRAAMAVKKILTTVGDYRADDPPEKRRLALQAVRKRWDEMRASPRFPLYQQRAEAKRR